MFKLDIESERSKILKTQHQTNNIKSIIPSTTKSLDRLNRIGKLEFETLNTDNLDGQSLDTPS